MTPKKSLPLSVAQRAAAYRQRRKENGLYKEDKEKQRDRMKLQRSNLKKNANVYNNFRLKEAERKREARKIKKNVKNSLTEKDMEGYKCTQTFGKAVQRAKRNLPTCFVKRQTVIRSLAKNNGLVIVNNGDDLKNKVNKSATPAEVVKCVQDFYQTSEITWQSPSTKDRKIIRTKGEDSRIQKTYVPKRYMLMSYREAYAAYLKAYPECKIGFSKFHELKPSFVEGFNHIPHEVCICKTHENPQFLINYLHSSCQTPTDLKEFTNSLTCNPNNENCVKGLCQLCRNLIDGYNPKYHVENPEEVMLSVTQWSLLDGSCDKNEFEWNLSKCFLELEAQTRPFLLHDFIKTTQASHFRNSVAGANGKCIVLQIDYAENFALKHQREIQSAHWNHSQCTIFTAYAWIDENREKSYALVSDDLKHGKVSVFKNLEFLFDDLVQNSVDIKEVKIFSDGAASQFKQRFMLSLLPVFENRYGISITWNFFASSHGKGVVDGIGATVKGAVWRRIRSGEKVQTALQFTNVAQKSCPNIKVAFISKQEIAENEDELEEHWSLVKKIPMLQKKHLIRVIDGSFLGVKEHALSTQEQKVALF